MRFVFRTALKKNRVFLLLIGLWIAVQAFQLDSLWSVIDDDVAQYLLHARTLTLEGKYNPTQFIYYFGATNTPLSTQPGFPLILLPLIRVFGINLWILKLLMIITAFFSGLLIKKRFTEWFHEEKWGVAAAGFFYFSMTTIVYTRMVYTEWPYFLCSLCILGFAGNGENEMPYWKYGVLGFGLAVLFLIRSVGISLLLAAVAVAIQAIVRDRTHRKHTAFGTVLLVLAFMAVQEGALLLVRPQSGPGYFDFIMAKSLMFPVDGKASFWDLIRRLPVNVYYFSRTMASFFLGRCWHEAAVFLFPQCTALIRGIVTVLGVLFSAAIVTGFFKKILSRPALMDYYFLFYILVISLAWINIEEYRYLMVLFPFLLYYFIVGGRFVFEKIAHFRIGDQPGFILISVFLCIAILHSGVEVVRYRHPPRIIREKIDFFNQSVEWLKSLMRPEEILVTENPCWHILVTNARVTSSLKTKNEEMGYQYLRKFPNLLVVCNEYLEMDRICIRRVIDTYPEQFELLKKFGEIAIYRMQPHCEEGSILKRVSVFQDPACPGRSISFSREYPDFPQVFR